ncbi:iron-containing alcohol dehydrogenase [Mesorhizobium retamae]|uniref:Iron-containing alcohol dehydrogenase n=1 Tax=Mesorhizobium retamae TaxID=2912854 RepID=A0ABS9QD37_9HYPH|nr:iron-containing alcohol dehydrogenase [Mesorhizobium sp. IRAMC:0171]MCG7505331.1 iron-containing alcohol dehydrogenase [Mesorhizobium sp. IRAMC:0171]
MTVFGLTRAPREILFGAGQRKAVGHAASRLGRRALICTDKRLGDSPEIQELRQDLAAVGVVSSTFDDTQPDVPRDCIDRCVKQGREFKPDLVIGFGGGSCLDLAKVTALLLSHGGELSSFYGEFKVPGPVLPLIAIPTTAGTGSEVTPVAVISDAERTLKVGVSSPHLIAHTAICDPELTYSCPPQLTATVGADALTHAIEAFTALRRSPDGDLAHAHVFVGKNALSDQFALRAISCIASNLHAAVRDGGDKEARSQLMLGSLLSGLAFGTAGTAAAHAIQYPVGALTHTPHGVGVATLMPYVMAFNQPACEEELAQIARAFGIGNVGAPVAELASQAIEAVQALFASVGIPKSLAELGLPETKLSWTAEQAMGATRLIKNNPRLLDVESVLAIITAAHAGNRLALHVS